MLTACFQISNHLWDHSIYHQEMFHIYALLEYCKWSSFFFAMNAIYWHIFLWSTLGMSSYLLIQSHRAQLALLLPWNERIHFIFENQTMWSYKIQCPKYCSFAILIYYRSRKPSSDRRLIQIDLTGTVSPVVWFHFPKIFIVTFESMWTLYVS